MPAPPAPFETSTQLNDPNFSSQDSAWGLYIRSSTGIYVFGIGLYAFYTNYLHGCTGTRSCQAQIASIGSGSQVAIAGLTSVGATNQLSVNDKAVILARDNIGGVQCSAAFWRSDTD